MKLRSSLNPSLLKASLIKGSLVASLGILPLLLSFFIPVDLLKIYGFLIVIISLLLITLGLYPYQKLKKLELFPHELLLEDDHFIFAWKRKPVLLIPFNEIEHALYFHPKDAYGIGITLKKPIKITPLDPLFDRQSFINTCQKNYGCDLFFPYFSLYSFNQFKDVLHN